VYYENQENHCNLHMVKTECPQEKQYSFSLKRESSLWDITGRKPNGQKWTLETLGTWRLIYDTKGRISRIYAYRIAVSYNGETADNHRHTGTSAGMASQNHPAHCTGISTGSQGLTEKDWINHCEQSIQDIDPWSSIYSLFIIDAR
jgi:hypothetical protein